MPSRDLTRSTLAVLFVVALIFSSGWIMRPFLSAAVWATMIVISTWPLLTRLQSKLGGRRGLAATVMTVALLLVLVIPLSLAVGVIIGNIDTISARVNALKTYQLSPPPEWVARIPIEGPKLAAAWERAAAEGPGSLTARVAPYGGLALEWLASQLGGVGGMILRFLLTVIISGILYMKGETAAGGVRLFANRLAGANGDRAAVLAAATIRGVAMGVIVTAIVQTILASAGMLIGSIPGAGLLTAAVLVLCLAQLGPALIMLPVVVWKLYGGASVGGFAVLAFGLVACTIDNFLRPFLIKKGADIPLLLIFAGVIGGLTGFGLMGIFIGPVILAVTYALLREWVGSRTESEKEEDIIRSAKVAATGPSVG